MMQARKRPFLLLINLIGVMLFVCSCGNAVGSSISHTDGQMMTSVPTPTPTPIPPVYTSCPATGTARAAVMPPLPAGGHQSVLYASDSTSGSNRTDVLSRYDVVTGQKTSELTLTIPGTLQNNQGTQPAFLDARISDDGQWIIFQTAVEGRGAIQLVRVDGKELQTLYCTTTDKELWGTLSFSPDTKYLTFDEVPVYYGGNQNLVLLNLATGGIKAIATVGSQGSGVYEPIKWRDNNSIYVNYSQDGVGDTRNRHEEYLLSNVTQTPSLQQINIPTIAGDSNDMCKDFDYSPDNTQLLVSDCPEAPRGAPAPTGTSTIEVAPLAGGAPRVVHVSQHMINYARFITNTSIWFCVTDSAVADAGIWKMNTDGTGLTQLASQGCFFQDFAYASNINISPDGSQFVFYEGTGSNSTIFIIGSMNGGSSRTVTIPGGAGLVGWATI